MWCVPGMNRNLMSVCQVIEKEFPITIKDNILKLYDCTHKLIIQSKLGRNKTFKVNVAITDTQCLSARSTEEESELWHKRLRHLNYRSLRNFSSKNLVHRISKIMALEMLCDVCMKDKQPRLPFSSEMPSRVTHALGSVHFDTCGPFEVHSLVGNK